MMANDSALPDARDIEIKALRKALANIEDSTRVKELKHEIELLQDENAQLKKAIELTKDQMFVKAKEMARRKVYISKNDLAPIFVMYRNFAKVDYDVELAIDGDRATVNPKPMMIKQEAHI